MNQQSHKIRLSLIFFIFLSALSIALIRLFYLQIYSFTFFHTMAKQQYQVKIIKHPDRASIFDRFGNPLAVNKDALSIFITPTSVHDKQGIKDFIEHYFPQALERYNQKQDSSFFYIKRRITDDEKDLIQRLNHPDIYLLNEPNRFYPIESAIPLVGITDIDNNGIFGIELLYNKQLQGKPSIAYLEKDARSHLFYFSKEVKDNGQQGTPITLTIDGNLQFLIQELMQKELEHYQSSEGGAIVMNPDNGEILALISLPSGNPNEPQSLSAETSRCRPITDAYEFGSVMKVFAALAALDEKIVTPDEDINCMGVKTAYIEGRRVNTVPQTILGHASFKEVIKKSNNIGIAKVAKRVGTKLYDHYKKVGFGQKTGIQFPGEQTGHITPPEKWSKQSVISLSYGYEITTTLLQLARAFSIFSNGGYLITPHLVLNQNTPQPLPLYSKESINMMRDILEKKDAKGAARHGVIEGYTTLGKTGTANMLDHGKYDQHKNIFCFIGAIEKGKYKRVVACYLKESNKKGLLAASVTAPLFQKIAEILVMHDKIW